MTLSPTRAAVTLSLALFTAGCPTPEPLPEWEPAFDASGSGWVMNTWAPSEALRFAVGGSFDRGRITRRVDGVWAEQDIPAVSLVNWVHGFGESDAWAVGAEGALLRWDGESWTQVESPTDQDLWGVWGASPDDVYAVGGTARRPSEAAPTILHYDGASWSVVPPLALARPNVDAYFKVWGSSASDVYVVGDSGVVVHYDGASWEEVFVGASDDLVAVWGTGPDEIVAVGGRSNGIVSRWDGVSWESRTVTPLPALNAIWMREPGVAHIGGIRGTLATLDVATFEITEQPVDETLDFHAIHGVGGEIVAVGGNLAAPRSQVGMAWQRALTTGE